MVFSRLFSSIVQLVIFNSFLSSRLVTHLQIRVYFWRRFIYSVHLPFITWRDKYTLKKQLCIEPYQLIMTHYPSPQFSKYISQPEQNTTKPTATENWSSMSQSLSLPVDRSKSERSQANRLIHKKARFQFIHKTSSVEYLSTHNLILFIQLKQPNLNERCFRVDILWKTHTSFQTNLAVSKWDLIEHNKCMLKNVYISVL